MMKSLLPEKYHQSIYIFALALLVIGMPLSKFLMSLAQIILVGNWVLEGNIKNKLISFWKNKPAVILSSLLLLHFIGLIYTSDLNYAFKDIRIKGPLLILPLILSTSKPLSKELFEWVLKAFVASIILGTIISMLILNDIIPRQVVDVRNVSIFISHIRFALLICVAIFVSAYFFFQSPNSTKKYVWVAIIVWLIAFLIIMESLTGLATLAIAIFIIGVYFVLKLKKQFYKYAFFTLIAAGIASTYIFINSEINKINNHVEKINLNELINYTSKGNLYVHNLTSNLYENGNLIWIYICEPELEQSWNARSTIPYNSKDLKGNELHFTLIRFLSSKGLRKDADAVNSLTVEEIKAIERGAPNVNYMNVSSLRGRLYSTLWEIKEYKKDGDANGHSLAQRFEYWKASIGIIKENLLFGVGTGDIQQSFDEYYVKTNSILKKELRLRSHNQYLSITVAFGIIGLLWFLITLFYPMLKQKKMFDFLYISFFIIALISFFTEDTLETQAGVTFYAFFNSIFLFLQPQKED